MTFHYFSSLAPVVLAASLLSGCATPMLTVAAVDKECVERSAPTGSHIARRDTACIVMTDAERAEARDKLQAAIDVQLRQQSAVKAAATGR